MNFFKPEVQKHNSENRKPILIRKDSGDGKSNTNEPKKRVTFKQCVEYLPAYQEMEMEIDQPSGAGEPANQGQ